ncbi:MAG: hypothetical protein KF691_13660 [Phycisphaeraceae bacterium]|nr:hypothetical protein [Phycisphaeraceae bacterium]
MNSFTHRVLFAVVLIACVVGRVGGAEPSTPEPGVPAEQPQSDDSDSTTNDAKAPAVKAPRAPAPSAAVLALKRWHDAALCSSCKGSGKATKKVVTGTRTVKPDKAGFPIKQDIIKEVTIDCPACDGQRLTKDKRIVTTGNKFAETLAQIDTTDDRWPAAHDDLLEKLRALVTIGKGAWQDRLNKAIGALLTGAVAKSGIPIVFAGFLEKDWQDNDPAYRELRVVVDNTTVYFQQPRLVDISGLLAPKDSPQGNVLCGGWLVRRDDGSGQFSSVINNGFVMSSR